MIILSNIQEIPGGDHTQVDPVNIGDKIFLFEDNSEGMGVFKFGTFSPFSAAKVPEINLTQSDLKWDGMQWYLQLSVNTVLSCEVNGLTINGGLDKNYSPYRYYNSGFINDTTPQTIKLYIL